MYILNVTLPLGKTKLHAHYCDQQGGFAPFLMLFLHSGKAVVLNICPFLICLSAVGRFFLPTFQQNSLFVLLNIYFLTNNYIHSFSTAWSAKCTLCYQTSCHTGTQHNNKY